MNINEKQQEIIDEFAIYDDWMEKYEYIIELGKELEAFPEDKRTVSRVCG
jgi:cysteine desulfuration protein SufE